MGSEEDKEASGIAKLLSGRGREATAEEEVGTVVPVGSCVPAAMPLEGGVVAGMASVSGATG